MTHNTASPEADTQIGGDNQLVPPVETGAGSPFSYPEIYTGADAKTGRLQTEDVSAFGFTDASILTASLTGGVMNVSDRRGNDSKRSVSDQVTPVSDAASTVAPSLSDIAGKDGFSQPVENPDGTISVFKESTDGNRVVQEYRFNKDGGQAISARRTEFGVDGTTKSNETLTTYQDGLKRTENRTDYQSDGTVLQQSGYVYSRDPDNPGEVQEDSSYVIERDGTITTEKNYRGEEAQRAGVPDGTIERSRTSDETEELEVEYPDGRISTRSLDKNTGNVTRSLYNPDNGSTYNEETDTHGVTRGWVTDREGREEVHPGFDFGFPPYSIIGQRA